MGRILLGILLGVLLASPSAQAIRLPKPPTINELTPSAIAQLNIWLEAVWQLTNGRYTVDVTTANPNSAPARVGTNGDLVLYNNAGSYKLCVNTTATTASSPTGTTWRCSANALSIP